ncbi:MAG: phosphoribosylglycinamide formyltransferase [Planctomycetota bacterium]|jgi:formyltetrahydrofolate-dependent phosphoribosylglycinamide formyltransferase|nr:phosphoribosylglycinamide formyltransferase [Planctomycetota bacterium]MDP6941705.1 phosphoribosylglycinamide formyltransferase [Planctomycetota bacterium]
MNNRIVVLASGGGRSIENLAERIEAKQLNAELRLIVVSRPDCGAVQRAKRLGIPCQVFHKASYPSMDKRNAALLQALTQENPALIVLAGWLSLFPVTPEFLGRVINIHPALLPAYGGKGFWGERVHRAVIEDGAPISGCTVHFVSPEYDKGAVILQEAVPVSKSDTHETLAARVFEAEKRALPEAIQACLDKRVCLTEKGALWVSV